MAYLSQANEFALYLESISGIKTILSHYPSVAPKVDLRMNVGDSDIFQSSVILPYILKNT